MQETQVSETNISPIEYNLGCIQNIFAIKELMSPLWDSNRYQFMTELWRFIKDNTASEELSIIFHDAREEEDQKPKLFYSVAFGQEEPEIKEAGYAQDKLIETYYEQMQNEFNLLENGENQFVFGVQIQKSPLLVMAKAHKLNPIQLSLFKGLFKGLN